MMPSTIGLLMIFGFLLRPFIFEQDPLLSVITWGVDAAIFVWVVYRFTIDRVPLRGMVVLFIVYRIALLIPTLAGSGDVMNWAYVTVWQLALFMVLQYWSHSSAAAMQRSIGVLAWLLAVYLLLNAITILGGLSVTTPVNEYVVQEWYFLGLRTRVTEVVFVALGLSLVHDALSGVAFGLRSSLVLALGIPQIVVLGVATGVVALVATSMYIVLSLLFPAFGRQFSMVRVSILGFAASVFVVLLRVHEHLAFIIEGWLGKTLTLTARTELWDIGLPIALDSLWFGHGINHDFGNFIPYLERTWQAHNQYLQLLYDGGLVGITLFLGFLLGCSSAFDRSELPTAVRRAVVGAYLGLSVLMITEIVTYNMGVFLAIPFVAYSLSCAKDLSRSSRPSRVYTRNRRLPKGLE